MKALTAKLAQSPTTVEDDEKLLENVGSSKRHRMTIEVRLGEKKLPREALALVEGGQEQTGGQADNNDTPWTREAPSPSPYLAPNASTPTMLPSHVPVVHYQIFDAIQVPYVNLSQPAS
jgi:hypothetical protein